MDYRIRVTPDKIKIYHINKLKKYHQRNEHRIENDDESENIGESEVSKDDNRIEQLAAIACVIDDGINENSEFEIECPSMATLMTPTSVTHHCCCDSSVSQQLNLQQLTRHRLTDNLVALIVYRFLWTDMFYHFKVHCSEPVVLLQKRCYVQFIVLIGIFWITVH